MADILFPRIVQSQALMYDAVNITEIQNFKIYFTGGGIRVYFSNNGSVATDDGTYEEYTGTITSGMAFTHTFSTTGQVLRVRIVIDGGAYLYTPKNTGGKETDYMWSGQAIRA